MLRRSFFASIAALLPASWKPQAQAEPHGLAIKKVEVLHKPFSDGGPVEKITHVEFSTGRTYESYWDDADNCPNTRSINPPQDFKNVPQEYWLAEIDLTAYYCSLDREREPTEDFMKGKLKEIQNELAKFKGKTIQALLDAYGTKTYFDLKSAICEKFGLKRGYRLHFCICHLKSPTPTTMFECGHDGVIKDFAYWELDYLRKINAVL